MTLIPTIFPPPSPGVTKEIIIVPLWRQYFYETTYKYETHIIFTSKFHHGLKEIALSPEQPDFLARVGIVATLTKRRT